MEAFVLTLFVCTMQASGGISEQVCDWHAREYYAEMDDCKTAGSLALRADEVMRAACTLVRVL